MNTTLDISAIVLVTGRCSDLEDLTRDYVTSLERSGQSFEILFVIDGDKHDAFAILSPFAEKDERIRVIKFAKSFGDATAIAAGFRHSRGQKLITLPAYYQVGPETIEILLQNLESHDMVVACRPEVLNRTAFGSFRRRLFHWLVSAFSGERFSDLGCAVRAFDRKVLEEISLYGEQHIFLPLLASKQGFRVTEVVAKAPDRVSSGGRSGARFYLQRMLDIFTVVFLVRFTKKPIRFFGMIGSITFVFGLCFLLVIIAQRLLFDVALADRPALLVSSLLTVLGLQIFALGLLGELIIFTHAREIKEYTIEKTIN